MSKKRGRGNGSGSIFKRRDGGPWCISWYGPDGRRREHNTRTTDKTAAQRILARKLADVALRRDGVIDQRQETLITEAAKPIETHLAAFQAMLEARQRSDGHIKRSVAFIREVCTAAGFDTANKITADGMNGVIGEMKAKGKAPRTILGRVVALKSFTKWLADHGKLAHDPLRTVKRPSVKEDRRLRRRMLTPTEWPHLRAATLTSGQRDGMNPLERVALYGTAIQTGLRSAELRSITKADLFLAGDKPYLRCKAENTKNGAEARQYIQADLAEDLRRLVANKTPAVQVFPMPDEFHVATMLRMDLAEARQQWLAEVKHDPEASAKRTESDFLAVRNHDGEELDFHALRHTCGSWLALQGVHISVIKTVMRHSTIVLTADAYGHLLPDQHAEAVGGMAAMMNPETPLAATGTAGEAPAVQTAVAMQNHAAAGDTVRRGANSQKNDTAQKSLRIADVCEPMREDATGRGRTRTGTPLAREGILSPLCLPIPPRGPCHALIIGFSPVLASIGFPWPRNPAMVTGDDRTTPEGPGMFTNLMCAGSHSFRGSSASGRSEDVRIASAPAADCCRADRAASAAPGRKAGRGGADPGAAFVLRRF